MGSKTAGYQGGTSDINNLVGVGLGGVSFSAHGRAQLDYLV